MWYVGDKMRYTYTVYLQKPGNPQHFWESVRSKGNEELYYPLNLIPGLYVRIKSGAADEDLWHIVWEAGASKSEITVQSSDEVKTLTSSNDSLRLGVSKDQEGRSFRFQITVKDQETWNVVLTEHHGFRSSGPLDTDVTQ